MLDKKTNDSGKTPERKKQIEDGTYESPAAAVASVKESEGDALKVNLHDPIVATATPESEKPWTEQPHEPRPIIPKPTIIGPTPRQTMIAFQKACWLSGMDDENFFDMLQDYFDTGGHPRTRAVANQNLAGIPAYPEIKTTEVEGGYLCESAIRGSRFAVRFAGTGEDFTERWAAIESVFKDANDLNPLNLPEGVELA